jgi:Tol biopolymer transport system component
MRGLTASIAWTSLALVARADDTRLVTTVDGTSTLGGQICDASADGRFVLFMSASATYVDNDTNLLYDLFVRDMETGVVERINVSTDGKQDHRSGAYGGAPIQGTISADGNYVAFNTHGRLDDADNSGFDVYLRDRAAGTTTLVSHSADMAGARDSYDAHISRDGNFVV